MSSMFERITGKSQTSSINKSQTSSNSMFERITGKSQATSGQEILKQKYKTYDSARRNLSSYLETQGVSVVDNEPNKLRYNPDYSLDRFSTKKSTTDLYTTVEKHKEAMNTDEAKALREIITEKGNDYALEKYRQDLAKVEQEDVNLWDKTGGNVTRAIDDLFSMFKNTVQYTDETGKKVNLPSYNDLKQQKVSENYDTQVGKFLGDALYNGTKILGSMGINAVTGGVGGSTVYFSDMYSDSYNNAKLQGYDEGNAMMYALTSVGSEYLTGKLLGSATKGLTGGKTSGYEELLQKGFKKISKNKALTNFLASASSEATEEFVQEYVDNLNRLLILEQSSNLSEYGSIFTDEEIFQDALYSAGVGAITGGGLNAVNSKTSNNDVLDVFKAELEKEKTNTNSKEKIELIDKVITEIDKANQNENRQDNTNAPINSNINETEKYDISVNIPIRNLTFEESARKYKIDTDNNTIRTINRVMSERGIESRFDDTSFSDKKTNALWKVVKNENNEVIGREVIFNPNAETNDLLQNITIHELFHDLVGSTNGITIKNELLELAKTKDGYEDARLDLEETYSKIYDRNSSEFQNLVDEEVVASILGNKLGDQQFISQLTMEKPSIARQIYNWVIDKLNRLNKTVGYKSERLFWEDVKNKFESVYRESYENNTQFSKKYHTSKNISSDIDNVLNNIDERNPVKLRDYTPSILVKNGIKDLPMYENPSHIRKNILTENEAKQLGLQINSKDHYHGLGKDTYIKAIDSLDNPRVIFKNKNNKEYLILTVIKDKNNNSVVVPIEIETTTAINRIKIDTNRIKSVYGYKKIDNIDLNDYIKHNIRNNKFEKIYEQKKERGTGFSTVAGSLTVNNISQSDNNVKSDISTRYSIQENQTNTQNESFYYDNQGRKLTKEQQEFFKDSKVRDEEGNLKVLYNGSGNHTVYLPGYMSEESIWGKGVYLTPYKDIAEMYGSDIKEVYVNIKNPLSPGKNISFEQYNNLYKAINEGEEAYREEYDMYDDDMDLLWDITDKGNWADYADEIIQYTGKDGIIVEADDKADTMVIVFKSNQIKNIDNTNPTSDDDIRYSQDANKWQQHLEENYSSTRNGQTLQDVLLSTKENTNNINMPPVKANKVLNPNEISNLEMEEANTTPILPTVNVSTGAGKSKFASNIQNRTNMLTEESKGTILTDNDVNYYEEITNQESLDKAFERLNEKGKIEVMNWLSKDSTKADSTDVAEGWILLKQYQDSIANETDSIKKDELNRSMVQVAKKLREIGTKAGQTVQAFNILNRLTPEGMVYYAQSELSEAFDVMSKNKTKKWIDENKGKFELTPEETKFIMDTMQEVQQMKDGYDKRVKLAEIQKILTDKLPPSRGAGIKSWMRISMLFNPKTQVRNVMGNAVIMPVNTFSDMFASIVDRQIAKKTGVRTTGKTNLKNYAKGFKKGAYESYNDFKKGINTRNLQGNRFEVAEGKSFKDDYMIGKGLNKVDSLLSFMLDAGDRTFYEATFTNSINNQLILNNTDTVIQEMVDIATKEALSRTWQDNNNYTKFVLNIRNMLNNLNIKGYGLGDVLIPFAKTPANLTKAIVEYSPAGLIKTINDGVKLKRALSKGEYTAQIQHQFVQDLGKATAGSMLYILAYALAKAGIITGESDEDKDVANFMKNTLGTNSYSIKIGDKSFAYDWAQPIAAPFSMMANFVQKQEEGASLHETITSTLDTSLNVLFEQSFLESMSNILSEPGEIGTKLTEQFLDLPARAVPTVMKQVADMIDPVQRTSFEYGKPLETAINKVKAKVPFLSQTLSPSVDTMGREIQKYGGKNNIFNVFLNPANVSTENISESAGEIYRLYKSTGETNIMPRVAPYYISKNNEKITLDANQRAEYQKISGEIIENNIKELLNNSTYKNMNDTEKTNIINKIVNYSYNKARKEVLDINMSDEYNKVNMYTQDGGTVANYYLNKSEVDYSYNHPEKYNTITQITTYDDYLTYQEEIDNIKNEYDNTNQRKNAVINYVNELNLSIPQKAMLIKLNYSSFNSYNSQIIEYINSQDLSIEEKSEILAKLGFEIKDGRVYW